MKWSCAYSVRCRDVQTLLDQTCNDSIVQSVLSNIRLIFRIAYVVGSMVDKAIVEYRYTI